MCTGGSLITTSSKPYLERMASTSALDRPSYSEISIFDNTDAVKSSTPGLACSSFADIDVITLLWWLITLLWWLWLIALSCLLCTFSLKQLSILGSRASRSLVFVSFVRANYKRADQQSTGHLDHFQFVSSLLRDSKSSTAKSTPKMDGRRRAPIPSILFQLIQTIHIWSIAREDRSIRPVCFPG